MFECEVRGGRVPRHRRMCWRGRGRGRSVVWMPRVRPVDAQEPILRLLRSVQPVANLGGRDGRGAWGVCC